MHRPTDLPRGSHMSCLQSNDFLKVKHINPKEIPLSNSSNWGNGRRLIRIQIAYSPETSE